MSFGPHILLNVKSLTMQIPAYTADSENQLAKFCELQHLVAVVQTWDIKVLCWLGYSSDTVGHTMPLILPRLETIAFDYRPDEWPPPAPPVADMENDL